MTVLILDQFGGVSPYSLQQRPIRFDDLVAEQLANANPNAWGGRPKLEEIPDVRPQTWTPPWATTVLCADEDGMAEIYMMRWDSSG